MSNSDEIFKKLMNKNKEPKKEIDYNTDPEYKDLKFRRTETFQTMENDLENEFIFLPDDNITIKDIAKLLSAMRITVNKSILGAMPESLQNQFVRVEKLN